MEIQKDVLHTLLFLFEMKYFINTLVINPKFRYDRGNWA